VPRLRFGQDDVRFELGGSKVRFSDNPEVNDETRGYDYNPIGRPKPKLDE